MPQVEAVLEDRVIAVLDLKIALALMRLRNRLISQGQPPADRVEYRLIRPGP